MAEIDLRDLTVQYGDFVAVNEVNLTIADGEFVVFLGPSGCGKTTTLRSIAGLVQSTSGSISFDRKNVNDLTPSRRNVAMVFQFVSLYPHLNVRQNITFPLRARKLPPREISKKLDWVVELFDLGTELNRYPSSLPPGIRQKVSLARAVVRNPAVLLLDEPLSAIDEQFREDLRWELGHLQRQLGVTTVYVTHDQREAMSLGDRIVLMNEGNIVQVDTPNKIWRNPVDLFSGYFIGSPAMNLIPLSPVDDGFKLGESSTVFTNRDGLPPWTTTHNSPLILGIRPAHVDLVNETGLDFPIEEIYNIGHDRFFRFKVGSKLFQGKVRNPNGTKVKFNSDGLLFFDAKTGLRIQDGKFV